VNDASGAEGRGRRVDTGDKLFFPSDGHFSRVVPLTEAGEEAAASADASAPDETFEREDETLVPARVSPGTIRARASRRKKGVEQSWAFMAAVLALSVVAGVAAGAYMIRSQRTADVFRADAPVEEASAASGAVEKVIAAEPAERPVPQASATAPQTEHDRLAAATAPAPATDAPAVSDEADTKAESVSTSAKSESVSTSAPAPKASTRAADTAARRAAETEPRAERPARAASEARDASPAPRITRSNAAPRRADTPARANVAPPARSLPISSPPSSARPKQVIQWP
jgi:hypothetical protein